MDGTILTMLGLSAGAITSLGFIPQLVRSYRTKKADDISYFMPLVLTGGMGLWFIYGFFKIDIAIMIANAFGMGCCLLLAILKRMYSHKTNVL